MEALVCDSERRVRSPGEVEVVGFDGAGALACRRVRDRNRGGNARPGRRSPPAPSTRAERAGAAKAVATLADDTEARANPEPATRSAEPTRTQHGRGSAAGGPRRRSITSQAMPQTP